MADEDDLMSKASSATAVASTSSMADEDDLMSMASSVASKVASKVASTSSIHD